MYHAKNPKGQAQKSTSKQVSGWMKYPNMITYHPTTEEKEILKSLPLDLDKALDSMRVYIERGATLSIGVRLDSGAYYATIRAKSDDWKTAPAVSAWHSDPAKALLALSFAMENKFEDFPEINGKGQQFIDEW